MDTNCTQGALSGPGEHEGEVRVVGTEDDDQRTDYDSIGPSPH